MFGPAFVGFYSHVAFGARRGIGRTVRSLNAKEVFVLRVYVETIPGRNFDAETRIAAVSFAKMPRPPGSRAIFADIRRVGEKGVDIKYHRHVGEGAIFVFLLIKQ